MKEKKKMYVNVIAFSKQPHLVALDQVVPACLATKQKVPQAQVSSRLQGRLPLLAVEHQQDLEQLVSFSMFHFDHMHIQGSH